MTRTQRITRVVLALLAASALAVAVEGSHWWSRPEASIGPASSSRCFGGDCERASLEWVGGSGTWVRFGVATWGAGLIAAACLVGYAASIASKRTGRLAAKMLVTASLAATAAGAAFVALYPGMPDGRIDRDVFLYFGAVIVMIAISVMTLRARAPAPAAA